MIETATELTGGAYSYKVPNKYFPRYKIIGDNLPYPEYDPNTYTFSYSVDIAAPEGKDINYVSTPSFANYIEQVNSITVVEPQTDLPPLKDIVIYYKTTNMMLTPNLYFE